MCPPLQHVRPAPESHLLFHPRKHTSIISISSPANMLKYPVLFLIAAKKKGCARTGSSAQADLRHKHLIHRLRIIRYTIPIIAVANIPAKPGVPSSDVASAAAGVGVGVICAPINRSIVSCGMNEPPSPRI